MIFKWFFMFIGFLVKAVIFVGIVMAGLIITASVPIALFEVSPVAGVIFVAVPAVIMLSVIFYKIADFVKDKKEDKLFKEAEKNRQKRLKDEMEKI